MATKIVIECSECDRWEELPSTAEAEAHGWHHVYADSGVGCTHRGVCRECKAAEDEVNGIKDATRPSGRRI